MAIQTFKGRDQYSPVHELKSFFYVLLMEYNGPVELRMKGDPYLNRGRKTDLCSWIEGQSLEQIGKEKLLSLFEFEAIHQHIALYLENLIPFQRLEGTTHGVRDKTTHQAWRSRQTLRTHDENTSRSDPGAIQ